VKHVPVRVIFCAIDKCRGDASDVEGLTQEVIIRIVLDQDTILIVDAIIEGVVQKYRLERHPFGPDHINCESFHRG